MDERELEEYDQVGNISIGADVSKMDRLNLETAPVDGGRYDKQVVATLQTGESKRVSNIFIGKSQASQGLALSDGSYANVEEIKKAISEELSRKTREYDGKVKVVSKKGQYFDINALIDSVVRSSGKITLADGSDKVKQHNYHQSIQLPNSDKTYSKGLSFGYGQMRLPQGDYISTEELQKALGEYLLVVPKEKPVIPVPPVPVQQEEIEQKKEEPKKENYVVRVTKKYKNRASKWLVGLAMVATLLSGFKIKDKTVKVKESVPTRQQVVQVLKANNVDYSIDDLTYETNSGALTDEELSQIVSSFDLGEKVKADNGLTLNTNSLLFGTNKTFGKEFELENKKAGYYAITGFSIVHNGKIVNFIEDLYGEGKTANLGEFINDTLEQSGLSINDVNIRIHLGSSVDNTRGGWCDITDLLKKGAITPELVKDVINKQTTYKGSVDNFEGKYVTILKGNKSVDIPIVNDNGNFYSEGARVLGSDGKEYIISSLTVESSIKTGAHTETQMQEMDREVSSGKKLVYNIQDCDLLLAIAPLTLALASSIKTKKDNDRLKKESNYTFISNKAEYEKFKRDFEEEKRKYEKNSKFVRKLKEIFYRKRVDEMRKLTSGQVERLYGIITNCHTADYSYNPADKISFEKGKIIVTTQDNRRMDITDIVMPKISQIGMNNYVVGVGLSKDIDPEEIQSGIRGR